MNDHDAIDKIAEILNSYGAHEFDAISAVNKIAYIIGYNAIEHREAKEQS